MRPCVSRPARLALVADQAEDRVQAVPVRPQVGHSPAHISDLLTSAADVPGRPALRTASRGDFIVPRTNRKFGDSILCRRSTRLPADLKQLRSTQTFRRHIKHFLFAASY